ncbi:hypothetical protein EON65_16595 [archaeon]|nr:MAG: hypothetical protein EON65_16595 [archaeon]
MKADDGINVCFRGLLAPMMEFDDVNKEGALGTALRCIQRINLTQEVKNRAIISHSFSRSMSYGGNCQLVCAADAFEFENPYPNDFLNPYHSYLNLPIP